jgi:GntR family transcriptional regulator/MocR family aminotransferase
MLDDVNSSLPLYRQIYKTIRRSILNGDFESGQQLPATRLLAKQLGVSRMTVINAYEQLFAEGYLEGKIGAGTYVASQLPEELLQAPRGHTRRSETKTTARTLKFSRYGKYLRENGAAVRQNHGATEFRPFQHGITAIDKFPFEVWSKIVQRHLKYTSPAVLGYGEPAGLSSLREAVVSHLKSARGVRCDAKQIIITNGAQQALDLVGRVLLNPKDQVWIENPGYLGARDILAASGAEIVPVPIDEEGFDLDQAQKHGKARLVYVTPSHQFPLGGTMSLARRLNLLEWARNNESWIIEDDYDSEFRYAGRPLASLQGLDRDSRVIYVGTFSKTMFPALRLGCVVVPSDLIEVFTAARALSDLHSPLIDQVVLAEFISDGHFARHVRRMRTLYEERQQIFIAEAKKRLDGLLEVTQADAGMHLVGWLPKGVDDLKTSKKLAEHGLRAAPVSSYCVGKPERRGLLLGYTAFNEKQIKSGVKLLEKVLSQLN